MWNYEYTSMDIEVRLKILDYFNDVQIDEQM